MATIVKPDKNLTPSSELLPLAAIREGVVFPSVEMVLTFGRDKSVKAINESFANNREIVFVTQKKSGVIDPSPEDLFDVGVIAKVEKTLKTNGEVNALIRGLKRVRIDAYEDRESHFLARVTVLKEKNDVETPEIQALARHLVNEFKKAVNLGKGVEFMNFMKLMSGVSASELSDQIAVTLEIGSKEKQDILETLDVQERLEKVIVFLAKEIKILEIEKNIAHKTQRKFDKSMRDAVLRERMKTIQRELGEEEDEEQEVEEFRKKINKAKMPKEVKQKALKELRRFSKLSVHNPEYSYIRSWLETLTDMPWSLRNEDEVSIERAQKVLDTDHYGLEEVKERVVEYLSVLKLKKEKKSGSRKVPTIICFAGPPGVGKTSLGRSIAKALKRKFVKVSLGGIRDEAEIRGHRRTYVGAMPGRIVKGIMDVQSKNPVFMLDEIDKVGSDFRGDPSSALLEALDPEQNQDFSDHYLEVPFDLSEVIFITTANVLDTIPPALRDRLEIIRFSGYTDDEKYEIGKRHLVKKSLEANGLKSSQMKITAGAMKEIITSYTREAGVRQLERELNKAMRKAARKIASGEKSDVMLQKEGLDDYLGPRKYTSTQAENRDGVGVATGLAWTQAGGDILFVEVALMPGKGRVQITGQLGSVMQESAKAAWSYVRSHWQDLGIGSEFYEKVDAHIHVPEGAVPKDGPSAGVTMVTALVSALTKTVTRKTVGMTGEITLRGRVLEIGGVKEKVIAAHRAGLKHLILPKNNAKDLVKVPDKVKKDLEFTFADNVDDVLKVALK